MAIQTFTTGQVLTAAQVNDLNSNDFNQTVSAKTASYTLVAADKGTRITMSNASATTITVNTSLFAAGDTLFIQNLAAGVCTITAGTATVATSASLALAQHEGGTLYFTSAGVSTFFKSAGAAPAGSAWSQIATGSLSGSSVAITGLTGRKLVLIVDGYSSTGITDLQLGVNAGAAVMQHVFCTSKTVTSMTIGAANLAAAGTGFVTATIDAANTAAQAKPISAHYGGDPGTRTQAAFTTSAITQLNLTLTTGTFDAGTYIVWSLS